MDDIDRAQTANEEHQSDAMTAHLQGREPDDNPDPECIDCGEEIPIERRRVKPGCRRCIVCQEAFEIHQHWRAL